MEPLTNQTAWTDAAGSASPSAVLSPGARLGPYQIGPAGRRWHRTSRVASGWTLRTYPGPAPVQIQTPYQFAHAINGPLFLHQAFRIARVMTPVTPVTPAKSSTALRRSSDEFAATWRTLPEPKRPNSSCLAFASDRLRSLSWSTDVPSMSSNPSTICYLHM